MQDRIFPYLSAVLFVAASVFLILWRVEVAQNNVDPPDTARLRVDSAITAGLIAERDAALIAVRDSLLALEIDRSNRKPRYIRVNGTVRTITGAHVDSLMRVLDRPLPE